MATILLQFLNFRIPIPETIVSICKINPIPLDIKKSSHPKDKLGLNIANRRILKMLNNPIKIIKIPEIRIPLGILRYLEFINFA